MASGKKNYFRHSFFARNDIKLLRFRDEVGVGFYFYFFSLLELCGEESSSELVTDYEFHNSTIRSLWSVNLRKCESISEKMNAVGLLKFKKLENSFLFIIPNYAKYLGKYTNKIEPNGPNKRKEKEIKENKIKGKERKEKKQTTNPRVQKIIDLWNDNCDKLPKIRAVSESRKNKIQTRLKSFPDEAIWLEAIQKLSTSDFCNGLNDRSWVADFNFLIQPDSIEKVLEGKYDNRKVLTQRDIQSIKVQKENPYVN